MSIKTSAK